MQESMNSIEEALSNLSNSMDFIEEKIRIRDSELTGISSSIQFYNTELESASSTIRTSKLRQKLTLQTLKTRKRNAKSQFLEAELGYYIKIQELSSLKDYLKSLKIYQDFEKSEKEFKLKILENRKNFSSRIRGKLIKSNECNSFYKFLDENLSKKSDTYFQDLIGKFELKSRLVLLGELKLWSSTRIFQSMKIKIIDDFHFQAEQIRNRTRERLKENRKNFEKVTFELNEGIGNAQKLIETRMSEKPGLDFKIRFLERHLETLEDRVKRKRRKHKRCLKKIKRLTSKLADSEIKLARLKSRYFIGCL
jgi:chromosome segregation ATPase